MFNGLENTDPRHRETVLVIDDGELTAHQVKAALRADSRRVLVCGTAKEALAVLPDIVPGLHHREPRSRRPEGPAAPRRAARSRARREGHLHVQRAVDGARGERGPLGAVDVLVRPVKPHLLVAAVDRVMAEARTSHQLDAARDDIQDRYGFSHLLTQSPRMLVVFDQIRAVAETDATVLIRGETGTGKELVSRAIHERSRRKDKPFISVNCGASPSRCSRASCSVTSADRSRAPSASARACSRWRTAARSSSTSSARRRSTCR
jgi:DNA-binding NtrC family response regulator